MDHGLLQSHTANATAPTNTLLPVQAASKDIEEHNTSSVRTSTTEDNVQPCAEGRAHPLHTVRLERICAVCEYEREERLRTLESSISEIKFEPWRWRTKYRGGKDGLSGENDGSKLSSSVRPKDVRASVLGLSATVGSWMKDWAQRKDSGMGNEVV